MNASASEQIAITTARVASARTATRPLLATESRMLRGKPVYMAAVAAPMMRKPPAFRKSCCAICRNVPTLVSAAT
jgi:hypothetical protein